MGDGTVVLHGGTVRTLDPRHPPAAALVVRGERIDAVLDDPRDAPAGARRVDLEGGCVLPGFTDAHVHFPALGARPARACGCSDARSLAEAVDRVARAAADAPPGTWLRGRGWRRETVGCRRRAHARGARRGRPGVPRRAARPRRPLPVAELRRSRLGGRRPRDAGRRRRARRRRRADRASCARRRRGASRRAPSRPSRDAAADARGAAGRRRRGRGRRSTTRTAAAARPELFAALRDAGA